MLKVASTGAVTIQPPVNIASAFVLQNAAATNIIQADTVDQGNGIMFEIASSSGTSLLDVLGNGQVSIGSSSPTGDFTVVDPTANATTTGVVGSSSQPACLILYASNGTPVYVTVSNAGALVASTTTCKTGN